MKKDFKVQYFQSICERYSRSSKFTKSKILDEFCRVCKYNRKYAIGKLGGPPAEDRQYLQQKAKKHRQRPSIYANQTINVLAEVWEAAKYPCSTRLVALLPLWMPWIEKYFQISAQTKQQLLRISPRQIDRRLRKHRSKLKKRIYGGTKPGTLLKHQIPIKTDCWDVKEPGFTEIDTVSHSGNNASGEFVYSVNQTDILTGWVETRAVLGKGEKEVSQKIEDMEQYFPFRIHGIDADNGSEFINYHLQGICQRKEIQFTRGRPYKKNDNAHIEQKNWTHVRKLFGWVRFDTQAAADAMNNLYRNELHLFINLFLPSTKLLKKARVGSKTKRTYDKPKTPLDRVIESGKGDATKIELHRRLQQQLDPFRLAHAIDKKITTIFKLANYRQSPKNFVDAQTTSVDQNHLKPITRDKLKRAVAAEISRMFGIRAVVGNSHSQVFR